MMNSKEHFELNGTIYCRSGKNYCYKNGGEDNKGVVRIPVAEYEKAWDEFVAMASPVDEEQEWEAEVTGPKAEAKKAAEASDKAAEKAVNKKAPKKAEKAPKKDTEKKARTPKDVAFNMEVDGKNITLTAKQVDFIKHLPDTCFWENGLDSEIWTDYLCDEIGGQFADKPMTVGAMISTLCEKGLGFRRKDRVNGKKCTSFALTDAGKVVAKALGLED